MSIIILLIEVLWGCRIFSPRESDPPQHNTEWNTFVVTPEKALENIIYVFQDQQNVAKYNEILDDDFKYYFASQDIVEYDISSNWNSESEIESLNLFHTSYSDNNGITLQLDQYDDDEIQTNRAEMIRYYNLYVEGETDTEIFQGKWKIILKNVSGFWKIYQWYDYRENGDNTIGRMKYELYQ